MDKDSWKKISHEEKLKPFAQIILNYITYIIVAYIILRNYTVKSYHPDLIYQVFRAALFLSSRLLYLEIRFLSAS